MAGRDRQGSVEEGKIRRGRAFTPGHRRLRAQSHPCSAEGFGGIVAPAVCTVSDAKRDNQTVLEFPAFKFPAMSSPLRTTATRTRWRTSSTRVFRTLPHPRAQFVWSGLADSFKSTQLRSSEGVTLFGRPTFSEQMAVLLLLTSMTHRSGLNLEVVLICRYKRFERGLKV